MAWNKFIPATEITDKVTNATVLFAEEFGTYLGTDEKGVNNNGRTITIASKLTTSQLRKFFGEVKRQQMNGWDETAFALLKPKLAYAKGRANINKKRNQINKIDDFYTIIVAAIDLVLKSADKKKAFNNFTQIFEAIVAYHKAAEEQK